MKKKLLKFGRQLTPYKARALAVFSNENKLYLLYQSSMSSVGLFQIDKSPNGVDFSLFDDSASIKIADGKKENIANCSDFRISKAGQRFFLTYKNTLNKKSHLEGANSSDLVNWEKSGRISTPGETGMLVPEFKHRGEYVLYFGEQSIVVASSRDLIKWRVLGGPINQLMENSKGIEIKIAEVKEVEEGILLIYYLKKIKRKNIFSIKAALFDKEHPSKILWDKLIWEQSKEFEKKNSLPLGAILGGNKLVTYWQAKNGEIFTLTFPYFASVLTHIKPVFISPIISKFKKNPILEPIIHHFWESKAVFNPTAFYDEGKVHLVYRAVGDDDVSVLGYAKSRDGVTIDERLNHPIYIPTQPFEGGRIRKRPKADLIKRYVNPAFLSGPGWGGCEDPRITKIDDRLYMLYVAFDGWRPQRLALTSIICDDFHAQRWNWTKPVLVSPPGEAHKNWVIFPEKIRGKFAILHSITPSISVDYLDSLDFNDATFISSTWKQVTRRGCWDTSVRGAGPPPIKTKDGWLLFYHAMDKNDPGRYKLGAMLLDYNNPEKILYRARAPILEPDKSYENDGFKAGVIFACGALVIDDTLHLYYGGSDTYVCAATAKLPEFLDQLKESGPVTLESEELY